LPLVLLLGTTEKSLAPILLMCASVLAGTAPRVGAAVEGAEQ